MKVSTNKRNMNEKMKTVDPSLLVFTQNGRHFVYTHGNEGSG